MYQVKRHGDHYAIWSSTMALWLTELDSKSEPTVELWESQKEAEEMCDSLNRLSTSLDEEEYPESLGEFLDFIMADIEKNPGSLIPLTQEMLDELEELTAGVEIDLDEPLEGEND